MKTLVVSLSLACLLALAPTAGLAQNQPTREQQKPAASGKQVGDNVKAAQMFRTSTLDGMNVKNAEGEELGEIKELVIDLDKGTVKYAALSYGGVLGVGDKVFLFPWKHFTLKHGEKEKFFLLDVNKQQLETAKGFDTDRWSTIGTPEFAQESEEFFQTASKPVTKTEKTETKRR